VAPGGPAGAGARPRLPRQDAPKAVPSGIYDLATDAGWVAVGCDGTPPRWRWRPCTAGGTVRQAPLPGADRLLITADTGGANGYRVRAWKQELAGFAHAAGLEVTVCHFPPGTSTWNQIEHRLVSRISTNWHGRPLTSHEVVVNTIGATTARTGLTVHAELDPAAPHRRHDPRRGHGGAAADRPRLAPHLERHPAARAAHTAAGAKLPGPHPARGPGPGLAAPPTLTGMDTRASPTCWPQSSSTSSTTRRSACTTNTPAPYPAPRPLSLSDRLLVTVLRHRRKTQHQALTALLGSPCAATGDAVHELTPSWKPSADASPPPRSPHRLRKTSPTSSARPTSKTQVINRQLPGRRADGGRSPEQA
jgi:Rhodopirellula transposase DDE domain